MIGPVELLVVVGVTLLAVVVIGRFGSPALRSEAARISMPRPALLWTFVALVVLHLATPDGDGSYRLTAERGWMLVAIVVAGAFGLRGSKVAAQAMLAWSLLLGMFFCLAADDLLVAARAVWYFAAAGGAFTALREARELPSMRAPEGDTGLR